MKTKSLLLLPVACLLFSCSGAEQREAPGGSTTFTAASLPSVPSEEERTAVIEGHTFVYSNVYKDSEDNFVLKDNSAYIRNYDITFGLRLNCELALVYSIAEGEDGSEECELLYENGTERAYSISSPGIEICVSKMISMLYQDVNIGKIEHWC